MIPAAPRARTASARVAGVDAARALALVGMMATHILPLHTPTGETVVGAVVAGRASALFALLLGVGLALGSGGTGGLAAVAERAGVTVGRAHLAAAAGLVVRAALVGLLGLLLVELGPPVAVILAYYALLVVLAIPLLRLPATVLGGLAVVAGLGTPVLSAVLRAGLPEGPGTQVGLVALLTNPGSSLVTLLVTGYYPVLTWTTYLLAGLAVGRLDLHRMRTAWWLLGGGAVLAVVTAVVSQILLAVGGRAALVAADGPRALAEQRYGTVPADTWWWLAAELPHSGTPPDLLHTTGSALAVLGATLLLAHRFPRALSPLAAIGAVPLTLYALHVASLTILGADGIVTLLWHVGWCVSIGLVVQSLRMRGPAEAVVSGAAGAARRAVLGGA